jgi:cyclin A
MSGEGEGARVRKRSSGVAASGASGMFHSGSGEDMKRTTRAASKRAAIDDANRAAFPAGGAQQAKKRAALANMSNHVTSQPSSRNSSPDTTVKKRAALANVSNQVNHLGRGSVQVQGKGKGKASGVLAPRNADVDSTTTVKREKGVDASEKSLKTSLPPVLIPADDKKNRENAPLRRSDVDSVSSSRSTVEVKVKVSNAHVAVPPPAESKVPAQQSNAAVIASLERKTLENLYISRTAKVNLGQQVDWSVSGQVGKEIQWPTNRESFTDIDCEHTDPQMCSIYAVDIYQHLRMQEVKRRPGTEFMEVLQQDINPSMRGILIDWLVEVAEEYKLVPDTLYLTVSYIDRFLSNNVVNRQRLQLLGVSCMLIAAKYEEICAPQVEEFCYITDNTYAREEVLEMERRVLTNLHFELTTPTTKSFLRRFIRASQAGTPELQLEFLGNYLAELTLTEYTFLHYLPSMVAASAVFVARLTLYGENNPWTATLRHYTGYRASDLKECVKETHDLQCNTRKCVLPAIREKYSQHKFKCVATLTPAPKLAQELFEDQES